MAVYGGFNYTGFSGVNLKNTAAIRFGASGSDVSGTLSIKSDDEGSRAWQFPAKSGTFPIAGSFSVQLPSIATPWYSTTVTVAGIRSEDSVVVNLREEGGAYTYGTQGTQYILLRAQPGAGNITLFFHNLGNATGYMRFTGDYTAVR